MEGRPGDANALLTVGGLSFPAKVGKTGLVPAGAQKQEGDSATPVGRFGLRTAYWRPDRGPRPATSLPTCPIRFDDLWCDDPSHVLYNRPVAAPFSASHEKMWRADRCYDVCIVLDYNLTRPAPGQGSAIFFHLTKEDDVPGPTEGCVAVAPEVMHRLLPMLSLSSVMDVRHKG